VWHPDRFGSDLRLRRKAEDKLKQINDAYRVLSGPGMGGAYAAGRAAQIPQNGRARSNSKAVGVGWIYGCLVVSLVFLAGYLVLAHGPMKAASPSPASVQQIADSSQQATQGDPTTPAPGVPAGHNVDSAESSDRKVQPKDAGGSNHASSAQFRVRSLSDAETAQLESACSMQKELRGPAAYQACVKAQLDLMMNPSSQPDLNVLNGAERESIESVCSEAKRVRGSDGYNRCLTAQMASLAAEPARPDLSTLNDADRDAIESACRNAKYGEGPAAYDRCRVRFMKALVESR
jgi:hypothetical protein